MQEDPDENAGKRLEGSLRREQMALSRTLYPVPTETQVRMLTK